MARLKNLTQMTGPMAKISMYTRQGSDEVIVRTKGGPSKKQIKTKPEFEPVRRNNAEWAGCMKMSSQIRRACYEMNALEDYPVTSTLNALAKHIQKLDSDRPQGQRSICLSRYPELLTGLNFSQKQVLESVLRIPITATLDRRAGKALIELPAIETAIHLYNGRSLPYFRIKASLAGVCDVTFDEELKRYDYPEHNFCYKDRGVHCSDWFPTTGTVPATTIALDYPMILDPIPDYVTLVLCLGVEFGKNSFGSVIEPVKYSGAGKVMSCG